MSAKERVLAIRLMGRIRDQAQFAETLGVEVVMTGARPGQEKENRSKP